jgi:hypothetical protein
MQRRIYVGKRKDTGARELFRSEVKPTDQTHGDVYAYAIGPFRTVRGATFMAEYGRDNPHCVTVRDAEMIASGKSYDIVLHKWV